MDKQIRAMFQKEARPNQILLELLRPEAAQTDVMG